MNKLSFLFVTLVVGTFVTFGETGLSDWWRNNQSSRDSSRVPLPSVEEPSSTIIYRIYKDEDMELLETGLEDLRKALAQADPTVTQETKENKGNVLTRLGQLLENDRFNDAIKLKVAEILSLSCLFDCDHVIKSNLSELLIRQLNKNSNSVDTKAEILHVLSSAALKSENARDTLVDQGIIGSVTTFVNECKRQYALKAAALLIKYILSFKDLDSEKTHSLVPVLSKLLECHDLGQDDEESALRVLDPQSTIAVVFLGIYREKRESLAKQGLALDAVMNLLTEQTCMKEFRNREKRCELVIRLEEMLDNRSYQLRSLESLEKLYGFTQDGPQGTELKPRLRRIRDATRGDIKWYKRLQEERLQEERLQEALLRDNPSNTYIIIYEQGASSPSNTSQVN